MFESILSGTNKKEQQFAVDQQQREMQFNREQNVYATGAQEERLELIQQESKSGLIRWQQELEDELMDLVYQLKGWKKNEEGNWYEPEDLKPLCSNKFIDDILIPQCKPFISRNLINSNFTEERILMDLRNTMDDIADNMADGFDIYGVDFQNFSIVTRLIKNVVRAGAFRALQGWTKKTDSKIHKHIESEFTRPEGEFGKKNKLGF